MFKKYFEVAIQGGETGPEGMVTINLSMTDYITVVGEKALMLLIRYFLYENRDPWTNSQ